MTQIAKLRKTVGPLSAGTAVEVISYPTGRKDAVESGYATVKLIYLSGKLREQCRFKNRWVLGAFDVEADLLVFPRGVKVNAL